MSQPEGQQKQVNEAEILEQGDIYFFYRPKKGAEEVKGIEDVRRFFMVTAPEEGQLYRLFVIGKKSPDAPGSETGPGTGQANAMGFKWERKGQSSKHIPFEWSGP